MRIKNLGILFVSVGVVLRVLASLFMEVSQDGGVYASMGYEWTRHGDFLMPWGNMLTDSAPAFSHHYSPLWPLTLGLGYEVLGFGVWQTHVVAFVVSVAALAAVWWFLRDALGAERAWLATGILALDPGLVFVTGTGYSENLALAFFAGTLWGIWRSIEEPRFIAWAGLFAGLGYLTRGGMAAFFLIAAAGGLAWRLRHKGLKAVRDPWYWAGGAIFALAVAAWTARNVARFGWSGWQSSAYIAYVQNYALHHLGTFAFGASVKVGMFLAFVALYWKMFSVEMRQAMKNRGGERDSLMLSSLVLIVLVGWFMASAFWTVERYTPLWFNNYRYVILAFVPLMWLVAKYAKPESRNLRARYILAGSFFTLACAAVLLVPQVMPINAAVRDLNPSLASGTVIGLEGTVDRYTFLPYLTERNLTVRNLVDLECSSWTANQTGYCLGPDGRVACEWLTEYHQKPSAYDCLRQPGDGPEVLPDFILSGEVPQREHPGYELVRVSSTQRWFGLSHLDVFTYRRMA